MCDLTHLLACVLDTPREETLWNAIADCLLERDEPLQAELLRLHRKLLATCCEPDSRVERGEQQTRIVELLTAGVKPCVPEQTLTLPGGVPMTLAFIPPGEFLMGCDTGEADEKPRHQVTVPRGFFMGVVPVTQSQFEAVMGSNPAQLGNADCPVECVSWYDAQVYCQILSDLLERTVRLPTEAEWEYACRAGTTTDYYSGDGEAALRQVAWYVENAESTTHPVGQLAPNPWGLYDMHGNIWNWCGSSYREYPLGEEVTPNDPSALSPVLRGGCWASLQHNCRASSRIRDAAGFRFIYYGFRVCIPVE